MNDQINLTECIQSDLDSLFQEKKELDHIFSQFQTYFDSNSLNPPNPPNPLNPPNFYTIENEDEMNQLISKIRNYKNTIRSITKQLHHLVVFMHNNSFLHNPNDSPKYQQIEEENKKIDDIIQPFLLPILLRSFLIHNIQNESNTQ